ncbi:unnamed protein product [Peronospora destructor]|uniref:NADP-dependent oxidoreductase domain-containing protein n=1 Tax=Peronospora destructor TaxID=86335 RepID=A0AAV0V979_9STRA|nr:unnamed protein product [Peronospora destructor]
MPLVGLDVYKAIPGEEAYKPILSALRLGYRHIDTARLDVGIKPAMNQIELHPWFTRKVLVKYCQENDILLQAFSPLARTKKIDDQGLLRIVKDGAGYASTSADSVESSQGIYHAPKVSVHEARQKENLEAVNMKLTLEKLARLDVLSKDYLSGTDHISNSAV